MAAASNKHVASYCRARSLLFQLHTLTLHNIQRCCSSATGLATPAGVSYRRYVFYQYCKSHIRRCFRFTGRPASSASSGNTSRCVNPDTEDVKDTTSEPRVGSAQGRAGADKRAVKKAKKEARRHELLEQQRLKQGQTKSSRQPSTYNIQTPPGEKKDVRIPLPEAYSPPYVESTWYDWWEKSGFFTPECQAGRLGVGGTNGRFMICLPPPNVTGTLHLGHALGNSIQDAIVRWHRMCGHHVLWLPGCDHAGIATQVVVEKKLMVEQGLSRHDLGRDEFIREVWKWKNEKGDIIYNQMRKLGSSLDWSRECFTLNPMHSRAVVEAFVRLHDEGLIYRSMRLVNWSCALKSAISDIEVDSVPVDGKTMLHVPGYEKPITFGQLTSFAYPVEGSDEEVVVATTRLETMLGDVAVAVHPDDARYSCLHGRRVQHPITGTSLPIICDDFVDRNFGTGAVKVTPAHDHDDYEVGKRHRLPNLTVIDESGKMTNVPAEFQDVRRFEARDVVRNVLNSKNLLRGETDHAMVLPQCSRTGDIIEPLLKDQWYVACGDLSRAAIQAVESGRLKLIPSQYESQWFQWLTKNTDWCVSRQLWWGHQIPAYRVSLKSAQTISTNEQWVCGRSKTEAIRKASAKLGVPPEDLELSQDEDVLDTWFSSALLPFSSLGWPDKTPDLEKFYPTDLLETASDILFFWVARMVMLGQHLTGQLPFHQVLLHSILRDRYGRKMSKSLGNTIDPLDVITGISLQNLQVKVSSSGLSKSEVSKALIGQRKDFPLGIPECGVDALRFTLCSYNQRSQFTNVDVSHIHANRRFCNKIWQAVRFCRQHWSEEMVALDLTKLPKYATNTDRWILSRMSDVVRQCDYAFKTYTLNVATKALYQFWWMDFCDIYLEYSKKALLAGPQRAALVRSILHLCVSTGLLTLSPFMPFLTEELYQRLPDVDKDIPSVMVAPYPQPDQYPWSDSDVEAEMKEVTLATNHILSLKKDYALTKTHLEVWVEVDSTASAVALGNHLEVVEALSQSSVVVCEGQGRAGQGPETGAVPVGCVRVPVTSGYHIHLKLEGLVDMDVEISRLQERLCKRQDEVSRLTTRQDSHLLQEYVKLTEKEKLSKALAEVDRLQRALDSLRHTRTTT